MCYNFSMDITNIEIKSFIKLAYAHEHSATDYTYILETKDVHPNSTGVMEIGVVKTNPIIFKDDNGICRKACEGDIFIIPPRQKYYVSTENPGIHRHITTEAIIEYGYGTQAGDTTVSLPFIIKKERRSERIADMLKKIVAKSSSLHKSSYFEECSDYMKLLSYIKEYAEDTESNGAVSPSCIRYCTAAEKYAMDNIGRHIMVEEIADHIGISKNYLTNIFSKYKGMPITEYINRMKLNHMLELMLRFGYSAQRAGEFVGLDNVNYISRIFKKYYGVTIKEYRQMHMELI